MYRDLGDIDTALIRAAFKIGATEGVASITARKIAALCDISVVTIFNRFENMRDLMDAAAQAFDRPYMEEAAKMAQADLTLEQIWDTMLDHFMADPDGSMYYVSYTSTFGFDPTSANARAEEFLRIAKAFFRSDRVLTDNEYLFLWDYITSMAFYYAEKFIHGYLECNDATNALIKRVVFNGIIPILGK